MKNKTQTYQYLAGLQESTGEIIYSRARHDFRYTTDKDSFVDGGSDYFRSGWTREPLKQVVIELKTDPATLYNDWNGRNFKFGIARTYTKSGMLIEAPEFIRIVPKEEWEDRESFEYRKKYFTWGTLGKDGLGPRRQIMLEDAEADHLQAILDTQSHISPDTRIIIQSILSDRDNITLEEFKTKPLDEVADFFQRKTGVSDETKERFKKIMDGARKSNT